MIRNGGPPGDAMGHFCSVWGCAILGDGGNRTSVLKSRCNRQRSESNGVRVRRGAAAAMSIEKKRGLERGL